MKAKTRLYCSCGWEKWIEFDAALTNEEMEEQYKTKDIIAEHMKTHGQYEPLKETYLGKTRIKPLQT